MLLFQCHKMLADFLTVHEKRIEAGTSGKKRASFETIAQRRTENDGAAHPLAQRPLRAGKHSASAQIPDESTQRRAFFFYTCSCMYRIFQINAVSTLRICNNLAKGGNFQTDTSALRTDPHDLRCTFLRDRFAVALTRTEPRTHAISLRCIVQHILKRILKHIPVRRSGESRCRDRNHSKDCECRSDNPCVFCAQK